MKNTVIILVVLLINPIICVSQNTYDFNYKKVIMFVDSLLTNNKIKYTSNYNSKEITIDPLKKNVFINTDLQNGCMLFPKYIVDDTILNYQLIKTQNVIWINNEKELKKYITNNMNYIYIKFCCGIYKLNYNEPLFFEVYIMNREHYGENYWEFSDDIIYLDIFIDGNNIIGYKCKYPLW